MNFSFNSFKKTCKLGALALSLAATAALTACGGGGGDPYYQTWYDVYGFACGSGAPSPGCNFYANGYKIIDIEDPYYSSQYFLEYGAWYYYDSYGYSSVYWGWAWQSPTGIIYDDWGNALNDNDGKGRDYAADVAEQEKNVIRSAGEFFAAKYGLSAEQGLKVARIMNDYATIGKDRARTEADIAAVTERLYGVDFNKVKNALAEAQKGENSAIEGLIDEAATNWATTPETMKEILKNWYGNQLERL